MKWFICIACFLLLSSPTFAQEDITIPELKDHISYLASDDLAGRKPGTEGGRKAAEYIRTQLKNLGVQLLGDDGNQFFDVLVNVNAGSENALTFHDLSATLNEDFVPVSFTIDTMITAPAVFVGYGFDFDADSISWKDYEGVDVKDKFALVLRGAPDREDPVYDPHVSLRKKVLVARDHGAAGVLFISGKAFDEADDLMEINVDEARIPAGLQVMNIKRTIADKVLSSVNQSIDSLEFALNTTKKPYSLSIPVDITARTQIVREHVKTQNVVAYLEGAHPQLKDEYVILGAHYDHLGMGGPGSGSRRPDTTAIHNGADYNASGTSGIIEILEKLAAKRDTLSRSILFIAFGAEELGLLGSKYYADHPFLDLEQATFMVNLDMIGGYNKEDEAVTVGGTGTGMGLSDMVNSYATDRGIEIKESTEGYGPSDHSSFYAKDIPVLFFFSGTTEFYHTPSDDVATIEFDGLKAIADLVYDMVLDIANRQAAFVYQEAGPKERPAGGRYKFKVTLGIMPDIAASDIKGLRAEVVIDGRPAAAAGMEKGDIIVAMEGKPVNNIYDYMNRLQEFKKGQRISVDVMRDGVKKVLIVEL
jgi:hypothetical protein